MNEITITQAVFAVAIFIGAQVAINWIKDLMSKKGEVDLNKKMDKLMDEVGEMNTNLIQFIEKYKSLNIRVSKCEESRDKITEEINNIKLSLQKLQLTK